MRPLSFTTSGEPKVLGLPRPWLILAAGVPISLALSVWPLRFAGWFLTSLVHEIGHTAAAWLVGCPAFPAIRLDGHAAAVHREQSVVLALLVWAGIAGAAWAFRGRRGALVALLIAAAVYPIFAFTQAREGLHLAAGHLSELAFATVFFWRALTGGFVSREGERPFYSALGWLWAGGGAILFGSLVLSEAGRQAYAANGSFGLENDLVRLARLLGTSVATAACPLLLLSLLPLPLALWLARGRGRHD